MSKCLLACAIGRTESAFVRIKTSGTGSPYTITASRTVPLGARDLEGKKQQRALKKLASLTAEHKGEMLSLCYSSDIYLPLNAYFPAHASPETRADYCRLEAVHFLNRPEEYLHDHVPCTGYCETDNLEKNLILFYRAEPLKTMSAQFAENHPLHFCGSPLQPLVNLSVRKGVAVFLDLENNHVTLTVASKGRAEYFSCREISNRREAEYFAIHELQNCNTRMQGPVQAGGFLADPTMIALLERETSCRIVHPEIPDGIEFSGKTLSACRSTAGSRAMTTALMDLEHRS
ncbi:MAG: hypothetical protein K9I59_00355 [Chlorobium sp.]|uniref:hypothetical protein n=1 Tax=Chlorobium sp. TaxID=1095 RepID=UPI0025C053CF|nr:hypothetical protein [Chlorobium sp.]MCF8215308.1 hypothetical protein [Chlorobium sp.]MCF8270145.1 hypothetical protein [Chlorobium sp.]MCF8286515.1 hypothetical protein [Chlorobium sp.]MCF8290113.1 hypothetical protein [Chlorobium sp.]MCF8384185.1 hypothetical protein [Chlorobium sp.]